MKILLKTMLLKKTNIYIYILDMYSTKRLSISKVMLIAVHLYTGGNRKIKPRTNSLQHAVVVKYGNQ